MASDHVGGWMPETTPTPPKQTPTKLDNRYLARSPLPPVPSATSSFTSLDSPAVIELGDEAVLAPSSPNGGHHNNHVEDPLTPTGGDWRGVQTPSPRRTPGLNMSLDQAASMQQRLREQSAVNMSMLSTESSSRTPRLHSSMDMGGEMQRRLREQSEANLSMLSHDFGNLKGRLADITGSPAVTVLDDLSMTSSSGLGLRPPPARQAAVPKRHYTPSQLPGGQGGGQGATADSAIGLRLGKLQAMVDRSHADRDASAHRVLELERKLKEIIEIDQQDEEGRRRADEHANDLRKRQSDAEAMLVVQERRRRELTEHELLELKRQNDALEAEQVRADRQSQSDREMGRKGLDDLQQAVDQLTTDKALVSADRSRAEAEAGELARSLARTEGERGEALARATELVGHASSLESRLHQSTDHNELLQEQLQDLQQKLLALEAAATTSSGKSYREAYHTVAAQLDRTSQDELHLRTELQRVMAENIQLGAEGQSATETLNTLKERLRSTEGASQEIAARAAQSEKELEECRSRAAAGDEDHAMLQNEHVAMAAKLSDLMRDLHIAQRIGSEATEQAGILKARITSLAKTEETLQDENQSLRSCEAGLRMNLKEKDAALNLLIAQQSAAEQVAHDSVSAKEEAVALSRTLERGEAQLTIVLEATRADLAEANRRANELHNALRSEQDQRSDLQLKNTAAMSELEGLMVMATDSVRSAERFQSENIELEKRVTELRSTLDGERIHAARLEVEATAVSAELAQFKQATPATMGIIDGLRSDKVALETELLRATTAASETLAVIDDLQRAKDGLETAKVAAEQSASDSAAKEARALAALAKVQAEFEASFGRQAFEVQVQLQSEREQVLALQEENSALKRRVQLLRHEEHAAMRHMMVDRVVTDAFAAAAIEVNAASQAQLIERLQHAKAAAEAAEDAAVAHSADAMDRARYLEKSEAALRESMDKTKSELLAISQELDAFQCTLEAERQETAALQATLAMERERLANYAASPASTPLPAVLLAIKRQHETPDSGADDRPTEPSAHVDEVAAYLPAIVAVITAAIFRGGGPAQGDVGPRVQAAVSSLSATMTAAQDVIAVMGGTLAGSALRDEPLSVECLLPPANGSNADSATPSSPVSVAVPVSNPKPSDSGSSESGLTSAGMARKALNHGHNIVNRVSEGKGSPLELAVPTEDVPTEDADQQPPKSIPEAGPLLAISRLSYVTEEEGEEFQNESVGDAAAAPRLSVALSSASEEFAFQRSIGRSYSEPDIDPTNASAVHYNPETAERTSISLELNNRISFVTDDTAKPTRRHSVAAFGSPLQTEDKNATGWWARSAEKAKVMQKLRDPKASRTSPLGPGPSLFHTATAAMALKSFALPQGQAPEHPRSALPYTGTEARRRTTFDSVGQKRGQYRLVVREAPLHGSGSPPMSLERYGDGPASSRSSLDVADSSNPVLIDVPAGRLRVSDEDSGTLVPQLPSERSIGEDEGLRRLIKGSLGQHPDESDEEDEGMSRVWVVQRFVPPAARRLLMSMFVVVLVAVIFELIEVYLIHPLDDASKL